MAIKNAEPKDLEQLKEKVLEAENGRFRALPGGLGLIQRVLLYSIPVLGILYISSIYTYLGWNVYSEQYVGLFMTLVFVTTFLSTPASIRSPRNRLPWYDALLAVLALPSGLYITLFYPTIIFSLGKLSLERAVLGAVAILLILEGVRRFAGWIFVAVIGIFIIYGRYADLIPGTMQGSGTSWKRLITYLYMIPVQKPPDFSV